jgi:uncharacterized membrane protein
MRGVILAAVALAVLAAAPAPAEAARCGSLAQKSKGYGPSVVYVARSLTSTGGTTCRRGREVVRAIRFAFDLVGGN